MSRDEGIVNSSYWVSLVLLAVTIGFCLFYIIFFAKYKDRLEEPRIKEKFGAAYE